MALGAFNAGRVEATLGAHLERKDFDLYEKKLDQIRKDVAKKEQFKAELGADFNPRAFNAYQRELKRTERAQDDTVRSSGKLRTAFGNVYGRGGAIFAAAGGLYAFVTASKAAIGTASDINESLTKNQVLFGVYAKDIEKFSKQSASSFGISRKAALEYTGVFGNLFRAFGISQKSSAEFSKQLTKLAADMASFNNTSIEEALEAIRSGLVGESEPLRKFGVNISETALKAEALASGLVKAHVDQAKMHSSTLALDIAQRNLAKAVKEHGAKSDEAKKAQLALENAQQRVNKTAGGQAIQLNAQQKAMAAMQLTTKQTAAAHGDFARTSSGLANQQRVLTAQISDLSGEMGNRLLPLVLKGVTFLNRFTKQMQEGTGTGGAFVKVLQFVGHNLALFAKHVREDTDLLLGFLTTIIDGEGAVARLAGKLIPGKDRFDRFADAAERASDRINALRKQIRPSGHEFDNLTSAVGNMNDHLGDGRGFKRFSGNLTSIRRAARTNVTGAVSDVQQGLNQIRRALSQSLKDLGVSGELKPIGGLQLHGVATPLNKAGGGWIGQRGMMGQDTVPAMLAPGEAVLNRHQQRIIETLLGDGFLDQLFARVNTPHYFAGGGMVTGDTDYLPAMARALNALSAATNTPISVTSGRRTLAEQRAAVAKHGLYGPGNPTGAAAPSPNAPHVRGIAADIAPGRSRFGSVAGRFGLGFTVPGEPWHIQLLNAAAGGGGAALGGFADKIRAPRVGGSGALRAIVQASLNMAAGGATKQLQNALTSLGGGDGGTAPLGPTGGGGSNQALAQSMAAGRGWTGRLWEALRSLWQKESGFSVTATNPRGGNPATSAYGIPQALPGSKMAAAGSNWRTSAATQIKWGLGYIADRYGGPAAAWAHSQAYNWYGRGGFVQSFARGGRASNRKKPKVTATDRARDYIRPLRTLQTDRVGSYDAVIGAVDDLNTEYSIRERTYDLSDEELIRDDGSVDTAAVKRRADELAGLASIRARIVDQIRYAISVVRKIIHTYNTILKRLRNSLKHAKGKDRGSIKGMIATYEERLAEWRGTLKDLTKDKLPNASLDYRELLKERREVLGTQATGQGDDTGPDTSSDFGDTGTTDTGGDTADTSPDLQAIADQANARAADLAAQLKASTNILRTFTSSGDIGAGGSSAYNAVLNDGTPVGSLGNLGGRAAGVAGGGGVTIVQNISSNYPPTPSMLRAIADDAVSGITLQPNRSAPTANLGL